MTDTNPNRAAFAQQAEYCEANAAPITARLCRGIGAAADRSTDTGRRILDWPGQPIADALPLRAAGAFHALWRAGQAPALDGLFGGGETDPAAIAAALGSVLAQWDGAIAGWLDGPPQTNEPGRSAALMAGMLVLAARFGQKLEVLEIGSSAGLNLLIDRYRFDLGGVTVGPADSPVTLRPEWRGPPPPAADVRFASVRGEDIAPVDVRDQAAADRLRAYVWIDQVERVARMEAAIGMIRARPVSLDQGDAADWIEAQLAIPQAEGVTRVLMHSVMWQYMPPASQARIDAAMAAAGARATAARPLGWVSLENDRTLFPHQLRLRCWPGEPSNVVLAHSHAHGLWMEWLGR